MNKQIAWIDDEYAKIGLLVKPLEAAGYEVRRYRTYGEVIEKINDIRAAALIIMDLIIPPGQAEVDERYLGISLMKRLRAEGFTQPIIIMSVVMRGNVRADIEQIPGIVDFINKTSPEPIEEELLELVRRSIVA
jgi:FixJ family two-component response regulator